MAVVRRRESHLAESAGLALLNRLPEPPPRALADFEGFVHWEDCDPLAPRSPSLGRIVGGEVVHIVAEGLDDVAIEGLVRDQESHDRGHGRHFEDFVWRHGELYPFAGQRVL